MPRVLSRNAPRVRLRGGQVGLSFAREENRRGKDRPTRPLPRPRLSEFPEDRKLARRKQRHGMRRNARRFTAGDATAGFLHPVSPPSVIRQLVTLHAPCDVPALRPELAQAPVIGRSIRGVFAPHFFFAGRKTPRIDRLCPALRAHPGRSGLRSATAKLLQEETPHWRRTPAHPRRRASSRASRPAAPPAPRNPRSHRPRRP